MNRVLHRWPALFAMALLLVLTLSGTILSVMPAAEHLMSPQAKNGLNAAQLVARVQQNYPGVEQIRRAPSGRITAYWFDGGTPGAAVIDPATGKGAASADPNAFERWMTDLHRSLFLGDNGRIATAIGATAMLMLTISGAMLVARRNGGWRRWFAPLRGPLSGRLHVEIARIAVLGLALSSVTALWMTASTFDLLPDGGQFTPIPAAVSGEMGFAPAKIDVLKSTPVSQLREFTFPYPGDPTDVFTLKTDKGTGYIDQGNGALLDWVDLGAWQRVSETIYMLHTGQGMATLGVVLGLMALAVPVLAGTGVIVWISRRRGRPRIRANAPAGRAETILLVGSEGGSTWGFAATLHKALTQAGQSVHAAPLSAFEPARYGQAKRMVILAATYGDGDAPASAKGFLDRLKRLERTPDVPLAVLGFGDRSFPDFCAFADAVTAAAAALNWATFLPAENIDRQSPQEFARWGRQLGMAMGIELELVHHASAPATKPLKLISRDDFGIEVQAPTAVLRFELPKVSLWHRLTGRGFGRFQPGDLIGILPEGTSVPRFYSLASGSRDGFVEIVVKKHANGLCSGLLTSLEPGDTVSAFVRRNANFHAGRGSAPLILIGAGTGIGPLAGFVRANNRRRPVHLFFGMRRPESDFLYEEALAAWQKAGRLARLVTASSRGEKPNYVQDALRAEAAEVSRLVRAGGKVMVCGGRQMAEGVADAMAEILAPMGMTPATLKSEGRYVEDVY